MRNNINKMQLAILISQIFAKYECTYDDVESILMSLQHEFNFQRENIEYETVTDFMHGHKTYDASRDVVQSLNFDSEQFSEID